MTNSDYWGTETRVQQDSTAWSTSSLSFDGVIKTINEIEDSFAVGMLQAVTKDAYRNGYDLKAGDMAFVSEDLFTGCGVQKPAVRRYFAERKIIIVRRYLFDGVFFMRRHGFDELEKIEG